MTINPNEVTQEISWVGPETTLELELPKTPPRYWPELVGVAIGSALAAVVLRNLFVWWLNS